MSLDWHGAWSRSLQKRVMRKRRTPRGEGFTLVELLVVISVIAVLMGILMPALRAAKERGMSAVCGAHLHQWGLAFAMYTSESNGRYMPGYMDARRDGKYAWINALRPYYADNDKIRFCPRANRTPEEGGRMPQAAWDLKNHVIGQAGGFQYIKDDRGSYGINWWINDNDDTGPGGSPAKNKWRRSDVNGSGRIPVLMDCGFFLARPMDTDLPPETDGSEGWDPLVPVQGIRRVAHDRHYKGINVLFMDGSAEHVKVKELWDLKWHREWKFDRTFEWPPWMR